MQILVHAEPYDSVQSPWMWTLVDNMHSFHTICRCVGTLQGSTVPYIAMQTYTLWTGMVQCAI